MHIYRNVIVQDFELCYFSDFNKIQGRGSDHYSYIIMHVCVYAHNKSFGYNRRSFDEFFMLAISCNY